MHIADGVIPTAVAAGGYLISGVIVGLTLRHIKQDDYTKIALMSSAFFVASLIHVPLGPTSVHLLLPGVVGIILGNMSYVAISVGLTLQCFLFQFGGITALGANALMMGLPAMFSGCLFRYGVKRGFSGFGINLLAAVSGGMGVVLAGLILATLLFLSGENFFNIARLVLIAHIPVALIEALVSAFMVSFLAKVKPELIMQSLGSRGC